MMLTVEGNKIRNDLGQTVVLRGVHRPWGMDDSSGCWGGWKQYKQSAVELILGRMQSYGFNCLVYYFQSRDWINNPTITTEQGAMTFRQILADLIVRCANHGMYFVLCTANCPMPGQPFEVLDPYPTSLIPDSTSFKNYVVDQVDVLGSHTNLIIMPYSEYFVFSGWGTQSRVNEYQTVWQSIINGIRAKEDAKGYIHHIIVVMYGVTLGYWDDYSTANWMNFNWIDSNPVTDSAGNLVYSQHCYRRHGSMGGGTDYANFPKDYAEVKNIYTQEKVLYYSQRYPIFISEFGAYASGPNAIAGETTWLTNTLKIWNEWGLSYCYFAWRDGQDWENTGLSILVVNSEVTAGGTVTSVGQIFVDAIAAGSPLPPTLPVLTVKSNINGTEIVGVPFTISLYTPPVTNLLLNPSVESGTTTPNNWTATKTSAMTATLSWVSDPHTGSKGVRIDATYNSGASVNESAIWRQAVNVSVGKAYKIRCWYKSNVTARLLLLANNPAYTNVQLSLPASSSWLQTAWISITVPSDATQLWADARLFNTATGYAVFDDFELQAV